MQVSSDEDELMEHVIEKQRWSGFSKINQISTRKISPDIDFLRIDKSHQETVGYEFKLLRFRRNWKKVDVMPMYTGIGEAIHYFQFGVDKSNLVLGIPTIIPEKAFKKALSKISEFEFTLRTFQLQGMKCLGLYLCLDGSNTIKETVAATDKIPLVEDVKHLKECLLRKQFKYNKEFDIGSPK